MKFKRLIMAALIYALPAAAFAQCGGKLPSGNLCGNPTAQPDQPVSTSLSAIIDRAYNANQGSILFRGTSTWGVLAKDTNATRYLSNTGTSNNPAWAQINLANGVTGNLPPANLNGGTGASTSTFWRGDGTWSAVGGSGVSSVNSQAGALTFDAASGITNSGTTFTTGYTPPGSGAVSQTLLQQAATSGLTPQNFGASTGSDLSTTGTISSSSASLALASAQDYTNGQKIRVNHAGAANAVTTPTSVAIAQFGTAGATAYQYRVLAFGFSGSYSAAAAAVNTSTGNATLSPTNFNRVTWTASTGSPAGYAVYGRKNGLLTLLALVPFGTNGWNDLGDTFAFVTPDWLTTTPPAGAAASWLISTINSGGGTTTLTLANTASTTATSQTVYHDDSAALQAWITACFTQLRQCYLPSGKWRFTQVLISDGGAWSIIGSGSGTSTLLYAGSNVTNDILTIGLGITAEYKFIAANFTLNSQTQMGAGYGFRLIQQYYHQIDGVNLGQTTTGGPHGTLWHGYFNDGGFYASIINSYQFAQGACTVISNVSGMYLNLIHQLDCHAIGTWVGGGSGGIYFGYGEVFGANTGILINNALSGTLNNQFFHSIFWILDNCGILDNVTGGNCVYLDASSNSTLLYVMQGWASSGHSTSGANFVINAWGSGVVSFTGAQIWAGAGDGIKVQDATTRVQIDGSTIINGNNGWGVNAGVSTQNIYSDARPFGNGSGAYAANTHVEQTGVNGFRKHASGYVNIWGGVAGSLSDQAISFPSGSCPNQLLTLHGSVASSAHVANVAQMVEFYAQSTSGFTSRVSSISNSGVANGNADYTYFALCN